MLLVRRRWQVDKVQKMVKSEAAMKTMQRSKTLCAIFLFSVCACLRSYYRFRITWFYLTIHSSISNL